MAPGKPGHINADSGAFDLSDRGLHGTITPPSSPGQTADFLSYKDAFNFAIMTTELIDWSLKARACKMCAEMREAYQPVRI